MKKEKESLTTLRRETQRLAQIANKRIERLEKNNYEEIPAYKWFKDNVNRKFSTKGKDYNELQSEFWKLKHFTDMKTSTITGSRDYLKKMADATHIQYKNLEDLRIYHENFFKLADKLEEYHKKKGGVRVHYKQYWKTINIAVEHGLIDLHKEPNAYKRHMKQLDKLIEHVEVDDFEGLTNKKGKITWSRIF